MGSIFNTSAAKDLGKKCIWKKKEFKRTKNRETSWKSLNKSFWNIFKLKKENEAIKYN